MAQIAARDNDANPNSGRVTYFIADSPLPLANDTSSGQGVFQIGYSSGVITLIENLNASQGTYAQFVLTIEAHDLGAAPRSAVTTLSIVPVDTALPEPIFTEDQYVVGVPENMSVNSIVPLNVTCTETNPISDPVDLVVTLVDGNGTDHFAFKDGSVIVLVQELDYETPPNAYTLEFLCTNPFNLTGTGSAVILVENVDDNPFTFENESYVVSIPENIPLNEVILQVRAFDPDEPDVEVTYHAQPQISEFIVVAHTGEIEVEQALDREVESNYTLVIEAHKLNGETSNTTVTIIVLDVNDNKPFFEPPIYVVTNLTTRSQVGDVVTTVRANDIDKDENGTVRYELETNPYLDINETTGVIEIIGQFSGSLQENWNVTAFDGGVPQMFSTARLEVIVMAAAERVEFGDFEFTVPEDRPRGSTVGVVNASVINADGNTVPTLESELRYELVGSEDFFHVARDTGHIILLSSLDYDFGNRTFLLYINASLANDPVVSPVTSMVRIEVENVNDNSPVFVPRFYATTVEEFTEAETTVTFDSPIMAFDDDSDDITYSLEGTIPFTIDPLTGVLIVSVVLDTPTNYIFSAIATDSGTPSLSSEAVVVISVVRSASVTPMFTQPHGYNFIVSEYTPLGSVIGSVFAVTEGNKPISVYPHLVYRLRIPDQNGSHPNFHIDDTLGNISSLINFDAESQTTYSFYVDVHNVNSNETLASSPVEVDIIDENDNKPEFTDNLYTAVIHTSAQKGASVLTVTAIDPDVDDGEEIVYSISSDVLGFDIDRNTGEITVVNTTLYVGDYHLIASADDGSQSSSAVVLIAVIPATPSHINFSEPLYEFTIPEDADADTVVGVVEVDHDGTVITDYITYTLMSNHSCFIINPVNGNISVGCTTLDRDKVSSYQFAVAATYENGNISYTEAVAVHVDLLDVNDNHPDFLLDVYSQVIQEDHNSNISVLTVTAVDPDYAENGTVMYALYEDEATQTESSLFRINSNTGEVFLANTTVPVGDYRLVAVAQDGGVPSRQSLHSALVLICVTQAAPVGLAFNVSVLHVYENEETGTLVGVVALVSAGELINPSDFSNNLNFMITPIGESSDLFHINPTNGSLQTVTELDREEAVAHILEVEASFSQFSISPIRSSILVHVLDRNDETPVFVPGIYSEVIDDSFQIDQLVITNVSARDLDTGANAAITFSIEAGTPFKINATTGDIFLANTSIAVGEYRFMIFATDMGSVPLTGTAEVYVIVVHATPTQISFPAAPYSFNHTENSPTETSVGVVAIEQVTPALEGLVYEKTGGTGDTYFQVTPFSGIIENIREIDRETDPRFNLTIRAYLPGSAPELSTTTFVDIVIEDENDNRPLFDPSYYSTSNFTTIPTGVPIITVSATDADEGSNRDIDFSIVGSSMFEVSSEGEISANTSLSADIYLFEVVAMDRGVPRQTGSAEVLINIMEPVPASIHFEEAEYTFDASEYALSGSLIGTVQLYLGDIPERLHQDIDYETTSENFTVGPTTGQVRSRIMFNFESEQSYEFTVEAHIGDLAATTTVQVNILDENDNRPVFVDFQNTLSIPENMPLETSVLMIEATDMDSGLNAELLFEITNDINEDFRVDPSTGVLYASAGLDREVQDTYILNIQVSDKGTPPQSNEDGLEVTLVDINDNPPVLTSGTEYEVRERVPAGQDVFTLTYDDADTAAFAPVRVSFVSGADGLFEVDDSTGVVSLIAELDYETDQNHTLTVRLEDNSDSAPADRLSSEYDIQVNVINEPDNAPDFSLPSYFSTINPAVSDGEVIGGVEATDADGDQITFSITSIEVTEGTDSEPQLTIGATDGVISSTAQQTFTTESEFQVTVTARDNSQWSLTSEVMVIIRVVPEELTFTQSSYSASVPENAATGTTVETLFIDSQSFSSDISYSISVVDSSGATANSKFNSRAVDTGVAIRVNSALDRETVDAYTITVTASRPADPVNDVPAGTATATLSVTVLDFNDMTPVFTDGTRAIVVEENTPSQTVISKANATDGDIGENAMLVFSLVSPSASLPFEIDSDTGNIMVVGTVDYEEEQQYTITVEAKDQGSPRRSAEFTYTINITNINDNHPAFSAPAYFGEVYAGAPDNYHVHFVVLEVTDEDDTQGKQQITFEISLSPSLGLTGYELQVSDREPYYIVAVRIPDSAQTGIVEFSIEVVDEGGLAASVPLYLSIFTSNYLITFVLNGVSEEEFLSCENDGTSACEFREEVSDVLSDYLVSTVTYYNDSVKVSDTDNRRSVLNVLQFYQL